MQVTTTLGHRLRTLVTKKQKLFLFVIGFASVGTYLILLSQASTPTANFEAESATLTNGAVVGSDVDASGGQYIEFREPTSTAPPTEAVKPTDATTGPRIATVDAPGGTISGTHSGKRFTSSVTISGPAHLTDCVIEGGLRVTDGPVVIEHCDITGWVGITTDNLDPNKQVFTGRFMKIVGPMDNDTMRIGPRSKFGDQTKYINSLIEDSIIHSPVITIPEGAHLDVLQFGGGKNSTFKRVVISWTDTGKQGGATQYINNGVKNTNVVFEDLWIEGGPMSYVLGGPMIVDRCVINQSAAWYGYVYPGSGVVLYDCTDDSGNLIEGS